MPVLRFKSGIAAWFGRQQATIVAIAMIAILVFTQAYLIIQNRGLKQKLQSRALSLLPPVGATVGPLHGRDLLGNYLSITYITDRRPTLLFVLSPNCAYCGAAWASWTALLAQVDQNRVRVVFVNVGSGFDRFYASQHGLANALAIANVDPRDRVAYNLILVPEVIEIAPGGIVEHTWVGELDQPTRSSLEQIVSGFRTATKAANAAR